jgi:hypothetical protein
LVELLVDLLDGRDVCSNDQKKAHHKTIEKDGVLRSGAEKNNCETVPNHNIGERSDFQGLFVCESQLFFIIVLKPLGGKAMVRVLT